jgi:hypothetical protein
MIGCNLIDGSFVDHEQSDFNKQTLNYNTQDQDSNKEDRYFEIEIDNESHIDYND